MRTAQPTTEPAPQPVRISTASHDDGFLRQLGKARMR